MKRREVLAFLAGTGALGTVSVSKQAQAESLKRYEGHPDAYGVLYDSTFCIGCRKCEQACNTVNSLAAPQQPFDDLSVLDTPRRTAPEAYTVVNKYQTAEGAVFRKQQCNHCLEPACASVCFVKAFIKNPDGSVTYDEDLCVGCRYCMMACPFYVPTYEYDDAFTPRVRKCTLCHDTRLVNGELPGCVSACPTEAMVFLKRSDVLEIARQRIKNNPERYHPHIYGETEAGGTNWLYLSPVEHSALGQYAVSFDKPVGELTAPALGSVPMIAGLWPVFLTGAYFMAKKREKLAAQNKADSAQKGEAE